MSELSVIKEQRRILRSEAMRFSVAQTRAVKRLLNFRSGDLQNDRTTTSNDYKFTHTIPHYGRILDMKPKNRKPKYPQRSIYNRFVWGHYASIVYRMGNLYLEGAKSAIVDTFKKK